MATESKAASTLQEITISYPAPGGIVNYQLAVKPDAPSTEVAFSLITAVKTDIAQKPENYAPDFKDLFNGEAKKIIEFLIIKDALDHSTVLDRGRCIKAPYVKEAFTQQSYELRTLQPIKKLTPTLSPAAAAQGANQNSPTVVKSPVTPPGTPIFNRARSFFRMGSVSDNSAPPPPRAATPEDSKEQARKAQETLLGAINAQISVINGKVRGMKQFPDGISHGPTLEQEIATLEHYIANYCAVMKVERSDPALRNAVKVAENPFSEEFAPPVTSPQPRTTASAPTTPTAHNPTISPKTIKWEDIDQQVKMYKILILNSGMGEIKKLAIQTLSQDLKMFYQQNNYSKGDRPELKEAEDIVATTQNPPSSPSTPVAAKTAAKKASLEPQALFHLFPTTDRKTTSGHIRRATVALGTNTTSGLTRRPNQKLESKPTQTATTAHQAPNPTDTSSTSTTAAKKHIRYAIVATNNSASSLATVMRGSEGTTTMEARRASIAAIPAGTATATSTTASTPLVAATSSAPHSATFRRAPAKLPPPLKPKGEAAAAPPSNQNTRTP